MRFRGDRQHHRETTGRSPREPRRTAPTLAVATLVVVAVVLAACSSSSSPVNAPPLEFGIYPGGPVGTIGITDSPVAENPAARLAALQSLRAKTKDGTTRPFVVRLYDSFTGGPSDDPGSGGGGNSTVDSEIDSFTAQGFDIDLVVRYQPGNQLGPQAVDDYLEFLRTVVQRYAGNPDVRYLQVANETDITSSSSSSDGAYSGAVHALVWGVEVAAQAAQTDRDPSLKVGFNWAYPEGSGNDSALWSFIRSQGKGFLSTLSWVGLDDYPGTFTDTRATPTETGQDLVAGIARLRGLMTGAGIPRSVPIHVTETGYPTGPGRGQSAQDRALRSLVTSVDQVRATYGVSDLEWFDLRDSDSSSTDRQEQYGLMTDAYRPKSAFATYRSLVAQLGR